MFFFFVFFWEPVQDVVLKGVIIKTNIFIENLSRINNSREKNFFLEKS